MRLLLVGASQTIVQLKLKMSIWKNMYRRIHKSYLWFLIILISINLRLRSQKNPYILRYTQSKHKYIFIPMYERHSIYNMFHFNYFFNSKYFSFQICNKFNINNKIRGNSTENIYYSFFLSNDLFLEVLNNTKTMYDLFSLFISC